MRVRAAAGAMTSDVGEDLEGTTTTGESRGAAESIGSSRPGELNLPVVAGISLAILSGALWWACSLGGVAGILGLVALVPLMIAFDGAHVGRSAILGFISGFVAFGLMGEWSLLFGTHAWLALTAAASSYMAIYSGLVTALTRRRGLSLVWVAPAAWVLMDWSRTRFPIGGFGLAQIGYSQVDLAWGEMAAWGGGILVSAYLVAVNALVAFWVGRAIKAEVSVAFSMKIACAILGLLAVGLLAGPTAPSTTADGSMRIAVVQPYDENRALDSQEEADKVILRRLEEDSIRLGNSNDLIVWPEASLRASDPSEDYETREAIRATAMATNAWILANGQPLNADARTFVNRNYMFDPTGHLVASSDKEKLVPFGEYVPWRGLWSGWVTSINRVPFDAIPGEYQTFRLPMGAIGAVICFESTTSGPAVRATRDGASVIVVVTNNRSFEWSTLSRQHVQASRMRAIETGRSVVHAAISGISAFIGPGGSIDEATGLFERAAISRDVELRSGLTPYARFGDAPIVTVSLILIGLSVLNQKRPRGGRRMGIAGDGPTEGEKAG